jgi:hypothetical protein
MNNLRAWVPALYSPIEPALCLAVEMVGVQACSEDSKYSYSPPPVDPNWPSTSVHFIALPSWAWLLCRSTFFESIRSSYKENLTP